MGCPTWIPLPFTPHLRRMLARENSPWYPTVRLFRQNETRNYQGVMDRVQMELAALSRLE